MCKSARFVALFLLAPSSAPWCLPCRRAISRRYRTSTVCRLNRILFEADELTLIEGKDGKRSTPSVVIPKDDYRTVHVAKILSLANGATIRSGIVSCDAYPRGMMTDTATIEWLPEGKVKKKEPMRNGKPPGSLCVHLNSLSSPATSENPGVSLILALPRPLQLARLLPVIASMGCDQLILTTATKVPRDYWGTHLLKPDNSHRVTSLLTEGLAQSGDTLLPRVHLVPHNLERFLREEMPLRFANHTRLVAHPTRQEDIDAPYPRIHTVARAGRPIVVAVGPEGGWVEPDELDLWEQVGFTPVTLGPRVLRTDTAVVSLLALAHDAYRAGSEK